MRILLVEDEALVGKSIQKGLQEESFVVDWARTLEDATHFVSEFEYDTIVLDLNLPDGFGLDLLKIERSRVCPVLILTARDSLRDKVEAFQTGADDYLAKPFAFEELLLRIRALTRRKYQSYSDVLKVGDVSLDMGSRVARFKDMDLNLTSKELAVLELFLLSRGRLLSRDKIAQHIYTEESERGSNTIDVFVNRLRRKLETAGADNLIETVRGEGYVIR